MVKRSLACSVEIDLHSVVCPQTRLHNRDPVYLIVHLFGQVCRTKSTRPIFPIMFREKFRFKKVFNSCCELSELLEQFEDITRWYFKSISKRPGHSRNQQVRNGEAKLLRICQFKLGMIVTIRLMQNTSAIGITRVSDDTMLAYFQSAATGFLFPAANVCASTTFRRLLLDRTICFPASRGRNPVLVFSSTAIIHETTLPPGKLWKCDGNCALDICKPTSWSPRELSFVRYSRPVSPLRISKECKDCNFVVDGCNGNCGCSGDCKSRRCTKPMALKKKNLKNLRSQSGLQQMCSSLQNYCDFMTKCQPPRSLAASRRKSSASRRHEPNTKYTNCGCSAAPPRGKYCRKASPTLMRSCPRSIDDAFEPAIDHAEDRTRRMKNLLDDINDCGCFVSERPPFVVRKVDSKQFKRTPGLVDSDDRPACERSSVKPLEFEICRCLSDLKKGSSKFEAVRDRLRELESSVSVVREDDTAADCPICQSYLRYLGKPYQGHCHAGDTQNLSKVRFDDVCRPSQKYSDPCFSSSQEHCRETSRYRKATGCQSDDGSRPFSCLSEPNRRCSTETVDLPLRSQYKFRQTPGFSGSTRSTTRENCEPLSLLGKYISDKRLHNTSSRSLEKSHMSTNLPATYASTRVKPCDFVKDSSPQVDDCEIPCDQTENSFYSSRGNPALTSKGFEQGYSSDVRKFLGTRNASTMTQTCVPCRPYAENVSYVTPSCASQNTDIENLSYVTPSYATRNSTAQSLSGLDRSFVARNETSNISQAFGKRKTRNKNCGSPARSQFPCVDCPTNGRSRHHSNLPANRRNVLPVTSTSRKFPSNSFVNRHSPHTSNSFVNRHSPHRGLNTAAQRFDSFKPLVDRINPHLAGRTSPPQPTITHLENPPGLQNIPVIPNSSHVIPSMPITGSPVPRGNGSLSGCTVMSPQTRYLGPTVPSLGQISAVGGSFVTPQTLPRHQCLIPSGNTTFIPSVVRHDLSAPLGTAPNSVTQCMTDIASVPRNVYLISSPDPTQNRLVSSGLPVNRNVYASPYTSRQIPFVPGTISIVHSHRPPGTQNIASLLANSGSLVTPTAVPYRTSMQSDVGNQKICVDRSKFDSTADPHLQCGIDFSRVVVPSSFDRQTLEKSLRVTQPIVGIPTDNTGPGLHSLGQPQNYHVPSLSHSINQPETPENCRCISADVYPSDPKTLLSAADCVSGPARTSADTGNGCSGLSRREKPCRDFFESSDLVLTKDASDNRELEYAQSSLFRFVNDTAIVPSPALPITSTPNSSLQMTSVSKLFPTDSAMSPISEGCQELSRDMSRAKPIQRMVGTETSPATSKFDMKHRKNLSSGMLFDNPVELSTGPIDQDYSEPVSSDERTLRNVCKRGGDSLKMDSLHDSRQMMKNLAEELTTGPLSSISRFSSSTTSSVENRRSHCVDSSSFQREGPETREKSGTRKMARGLNSVNRLEPTPFDVSCDDATFHSEGRAKKCGFKQQASNLTDKLAKNRMKLQDSSRSKFFKELLPTESSSSAESMILSPEKRVLKLQITPSDTEDEYIANEIPGASDLGIIDVWGPLRTSDVDIISIHQETLTDVEDSRCQPSGKSNK